MLLRSSHLTVVASDHSSHISLDINVNRLSGLYNTLFLYTHGRLSPTVFLPLANFVKTWCKERVSRGATDSGTKLTSYSLAIMLLSYLVSIEVVDDLLALPTRRNHQAGWIEEELRVVNRQGRANYWTQAFSLVANQTSRSEAVGLTDTLYGFFRFLAEWESDVRTEFVSVRDAGESGRIKRRGSPFAASTQAYMVVQDPFICDRNVTGSLSTATARRFFQVSRPTLSRLFDVLAYHLPPLSLQEARRARDLLAEYHPVEEVLGH